ncbi:MAG: bifunctional adenosylcobinamide kinase/adenosylcobinamide-phosphate guanylyltransferase [Chloroflexota bacterium]
MDNRLTLLLGGARSGKSTYAEQWAQQYGGKVLFVATAQAFDDEMRERIDAHRASRPAHWTTLEAPQNTGDYIRAGWADHDTAVVDCMTLLASNAMLALPDDATQEAVTGAVVAEAENLLAAFRQTGGQWLVVSNEVGMGVVPPTRMGRFYRDALGRANQVLASAADEVLLFVAGLPWQLK